MSGIMSDLFLQKVSRLGRQFQVGRSKPEKWLTAAVGGQEHIRWAGNRGRY